MDDQAAARQALAEVVVGVADEAHLDAGRHEGTEALSGRAGERDVDRVVGKTGATPSLRHLVPEQRADRPVDVADRQVDRDAVGVVDRRLRQFDERLVERLVEPVVLADALDERLAVRVLRAPAGSG